MSAGWRQALVASVLERMLQDLCSSTLGRTQERPTKMTLRTLARAAALCAGSLVLSGMTVAAPTTLGGMGIVGQWTDLETGSGEVPVSPWGSSDALNANRVGIHVEFANGLTGSATYTGVAGYWGGCCNVGGSELGIAPDAGSASGFFVGTGAGYANLHGLDNSASFALPMAFYDLSNSFTGNFDVSRENIGNSTFRAYFSGWNSVTITLYSSTAPVVGTVSAPGSLALAGLALAAVAALRRRSLRAVG